MLLIISLIERERDRKRKRERERERGRREARRNIIFHILL